jgi:gamma-glutamyltranspeptidase/glutathione hydrolase
VGRAVYSLLLLLALPAWADHPYRGGAVATAYPPATAAAIEMLNKGGNAIDAIVAGAFAAGVVGPYHNGIAGGGFAVLHLAKTGEDLAFDFREVAPQKASHDMYLRDGKPVPTLSTDFGLSVAVPGAVAGYLELEEKYGKLGRAAVLAPAIRIAKSGFPVTPKYQQMAKMRVDCLAHDGESARLFLRKGLDGHWQVPEIGTLIRQPELAHTLSAIAARGAAAFYQGPIARALVASDQASGGMLSLEDLAQYKTHWRKPLEGSYRGHRIVSMPPPSAGGLTVLEVLGQIEALTPEGLPFRTVDSLHLYAESVRRSYVDRAKYLGDPAYMKVPVEQLATPAHYQELARSIDRKHATPSRSLLEAPDQPGPDVKHTTHLSAIDKDGNAVAMTTTLNYSFGSCVVAKGTGVLLNDEMDDFAAQPMHANVYGLVTGEANAIAPGKTPLSSMSPTLVFQKDAPKDVMLAVGSPGGPTIPTTVIQVILHVIDHQMGLARAVATGRLHHQYLPDVLMVEDHGLEPQTAAGLEALGHKLQPVPALGDAEAVLVDPVTHLRYAASDPRNEGASAGQD